MSAHDRIAETESADRAENFLLAVAILSMLFAGWWFFSWGGLAAGISFLAFTAAASVNRSKRGE
jgi:hypothetical protein